MYEHSRRDGYYRKLLGLKKGPDNAALEDGNDDDLEDFSHGGTLHVKIIVCVGDLI